jgi:hypothetical protein
MKRMNRKTMVAGLAVLAVAAGGVGVASGAVGGSGGDSDGSVSGPGADQAKAAALKITGGGKANQVERDNENGAVWEVEVTKPNGATVDVRLDGSYGKVAVESDHADNGEGDAEQADDHGANEKAEHGVETNDDAPAQGQR